MSIDYRHTCDKCGKSLIEDGTEIYCAECYEELETELKEAKEEIEHLKEVIENLTMQLEELKK